MVLLIDNYDSFAYNLYQLVGTINPDVRVVRNDGLSVPEIEALGASHLILSPGPGHPKNAGVCEEAVRSLSGKLPILGVCLGHQAICEAFGATVTYAKTLMHGKQSAVTVDADCPIFAGLPETVTVGRYHSLAAREDTLPPELKVTARADDGEVMAVQRREYPVFGLQFHPESILTPDGEMMLRNFLGGHYD